MAVYVECDGCDQTELMMNIHYVWKLPDGWEAFRQRDGQKKIYCVTCAEKLDQEAQER